MDAVGQVGDNLTTPSQLALMNWVSTYQETLRGLGVQEVGTVEGCDGGVKRMGPMQSSGWLLGMQAGG